MNLTELIDKLRDKITTKDQWEAEKQSVLAQLTDAETKIKDYSESAVTATQMKTDYETKLANLSKASESQLTELKANSEKAVAELKTSHETTIAELKATIAKLQGDVQAKDEEIKKVESSVESKAASKAQQQLAAMNLKPTDLPAGNGKDENFDEQLKAALSAPVEKREEFFKKNKDAILAQAGMSKETWEARPVR